MLGIQKYLLCTVWEIVQFKVPGTSVNELHVKNEDDVNDPDEVELIDAAVDGDVGVTEVVAVVEM